MNIITEKKGCIDSFLKSKFLKIDGKNKDRSDLSC